MKRLKVVRVLILEGPEEWVRTSLKKSWVSPERPYVYDGGMYPERQSQIEVFRAFEESEE